MVIFVKVLQYTTPCLLYTTLLTKITMICEKCTAVKFTLLCALLCQPSSASACCVDRDAEIDLVPVCRELNIGIVAYSPLGRGFLTGRSSSCFVGWLLIRLMTDDQPCCCLCINIPVCCLLAWTLQLL